jgi:pteridine reductase
MHILITGAAKRVGKSLALHFSEKNHTLSLHYHQSIKEAEELSLTLKKKGISFGWVQADLSKVNTIEAAVKQAARERGPIDILINSASLFHRTPALTCTEEEWDTMLDTNLKGQFFFAKECAITMQQKGGLIINITDVHAQKPIRGYSPYAASKGGLRMLTKNLAKEWAPLIRVNCISPGPILAPEDYDEAQIQKLKDSTLLKELGSPLDIAYAIQFLMENKYITGLDLGVDGGALIA